jgi:hypothetical protein
MLCMLGLPPARGMPLSPKHRRKPQIVDRSQTNVSPQRTSRIPSTPGSLCQDIPGYAAAALRTVSHEIRWALRTLGSRESVEADLGIKGVHRSPTRRPGTTRTCPGPGNKLGPQNGQPCLILGGSSPPTTPARLSWEPRRSDRGIWKAAVPWG